MKKAEKKFDHKDYLKLKTEVLGRYKEEDREEMLFSVSYGDTVTFGIYVKEGEMSAMTSIGVALEEARCLFDMVHNGKLSAIHLREVAEDYLKEKI